ncbi:MAG: nuclear transport factor 2 family protein [Sphingomonadales bacterium]|nr:nuclear transport factor 2 family protein [Sphingomonadales bacterium]
MDPRLLEMLDHHDIRQLLAAYCHGCDRGDEVEMASTYAAESWDDHGPRKMEGRRFSIETVEESMRTTKVVSHMLGQSYIKVDGDSAGTETYFIATVIYPGKNGGPDMLNQLGGRYVDKLVREGSGWRIKDRLCIREWSISQPIERDWLAGRGFEETRRGAEDHSYAALGLTHSGNPWLGEVQAPI